MKRFERGRVISSEDIVFKLSQPMYEVVFRNDRFYSNLCVDNQC